MGSTCHALWRATAESSSATNCARPLTCNSRGFEVVHFDSLLGFCDDPFGIKGYGRIRNYDFGFFDNVVPYLASNFEWESVAC